MASNCISEEAPSMIVVMGVTGSGKSYFINKLAGCNAVREGSSLNSCTQECQLVPVKIGNSPVLLIDTPGFDDSTKTDSEILTEIARILAAQYELGVQLKGVIYIHRITDIRYNGSSVKTFEIFKQICGEQALSNVLLVTSRWAEVDSTTGPQRERELIQNFWAYMLGRGSNISRFHGDRESALGLVSQLLARETVVLELQKELVVQKKALSETAAGAYVNNNIEELKIQYIKELAELEKLKRSLQDNDRAMRRQAQLDWEREQARLQAAGVQQANLQRPIAQEVNQEIEKKRSGMSKLLPLLPFALNCLLMFVGLPPGIPDVLLSMFPGLGDLGQ